MIRLGDPLRAGQALVREAERIEGLDRVRAGAFLLESAVTHMIDGTLRAMAETAAARQGGHRRRGAGARVPRHADATPRRCSRWARPRRATRCSPPASRCCSATSPCSGRPRCSAWRRTASLWTERFERAEAIFDRLVGSLRDVGAAGALVYPLAARSHLDFRLGRWPAALAGADEAVTLARETHQESLLAHALGALAEVEAGLGRADDARAHANQSVALCQAQGAPATAIYGYQALALLELGLGNLETARDHGLAAERAFDETEGDEPGVARYAPDLLEVLWRLGLADEVPPRLDELERQGERPHHTWVNAIVERIRGLMAPDDEVDAHFARALELHAETRQPFETARTQLLHGERLRRAKRRADARGPLGHALAVFERLGAEPWAERARARAARHRRPDRLGRARDRHRRADRPGAPDRLAGGARPHEPRGRRGAVPQRQDDRVPPRLDLPQARDPPARRAGGRLGELKVNCGWVGERGAGRRGRRSSSPGAEVSSVDDHLGCGIACRRTAAETQPLPSQPLTSAGQATNAQPPAASAFRSPRTAHAENPAASANAIP